MHYSATNYYQIGRTAPREKARQPYPRRRSEDRRAATIAVISSPGGPTAYNIVCDYGAFTLTGQSSGLTTARTLTAAQSSFTLAGQAANLNRGYKLTADQSSFLLTGQDAGIKAARTLTAVQSSFVLSGQDATLTYTPLGAYSLTAGSASFTLTGQTATLTVASLIQNGSFETVTTPNNFTNWSENLGAGTIEQDATANDGLYACKITAPAGGGSFLDNTISMAAGKTLRLSFWTRGDGTALSEGRYAVWAYGANKWVVGGTGGIGTGVTGITYTEKTVSFTTPIGTTSIAVIFYGSNHATGGGVTWFDHVSLVQTGVALFADKRNYSLTGQAVNLTATRQIGAAQASFTLTGYDASTLIARKIVAAYGMYSLTGFDLQFDYSGGIYVPGIEYAVPDTRLHYTTNDVRLHYHVPDLRLHYTLPEA